MNKKTLLVASLACVGLLAACGGTPATSETSKAADATSAAAATTSEAPAAETSEAPAEVVTIYEHQFVFNAPGSNAETGEENTLVEDAFKNTKHGGPNYQLYINLLKEGNKVEAGRTTMYYTGSLINKSAMTTTGTWAKNTDGTYTINLDAFTYTVQGTGSWENAAATLTSTADGNVTWHYEAAQKKTDADGNVVKDDEGHVVLDETPKSYDTVLNTQKSFEGEYQGTFYSVTDLEATGETEYNSIDSMEVTALEDGSYTIKGAMEDSGISAFTGTITSQGIFSAEITRLDGTMSGYFFTDVDGTVKFNIDSEARERVAKAYGTIIE